MPLFISCSSPASSLLRLFSSDIFFFSFLLRFYFDADIFVDASSFFAISPDITLLSFFFLLMLFLPLTAPL